MNGIIKIMVADYQPTTYYVLSHIGKITEEKTFSGTFVESTLPANIHNLVDCIIHDKSPLNYGFVEE